MSEQQGSPPKAKGEHVLMTHRTHLSRVLIAEDHPGQLTTLMELIGSEGYEVIGCSTATDALKQAQTHDFGIAIVDLHLPDLGGAHLLEQLHHSNGNIRVIIHTGYGSFDSAKTALNTGAFAYIEKGSDPQELLHQVDRAMRSQLDTYAQELEAAVTERTTSLLEREEQFRQLAEHIHEVFWLSTPDRTRFLYVSSAYETVWGRTCGSLYQEAKNFLEGVHPDDLDRVSSAFSHPVTGEVNQEYRIIRPDGTIRWIWERVFPVCSPIGTVYRLAGLSEDITERKQAEEALRESEQKLSHIQKMEAIGTLAGGIAHDFNNILSAILGYTELALCNTADGSRAARHMQEVRIAGQRAKNLVRQILAFSHQHDLKNKFVSLSSIVYEVLTLLRASLPSTIEIRQNLTTHAPVFADSNQLHQVLMNLCANAEHAMRETGGILEVSVEEKEITSAFLKLHPGLEPGLYLSLKIRDTGHGIPKEFTNKIFDPFFTTKPVGEGTGIGLSVVHGIVANHGGAIFMESTSGEGTTFEILLPKGHSIETNAVQDKPFDGGTESILFVDDEEPLTRLGKEWLTRLGYHVTTSTNSLEALETFRRTPEQFHLVIADQTMPHLTGEGLSREILRIRPELPIILCTGFSHIMNEEKAKALGIRALLIKPIALQDLSHTIRQILEKTMVTDINHR